MISNLKTLALLIILMYSQNYLFAQSTSDDNSLKKGHTNSFREKPKLQKKDGSKQISPANSDSVTLVHFSSQTPIRIKGGTGSDVILNPTDSAKTEIKQAIKVSKAPAGTWKKVHTSNDKKHEN